MRKTDKKYHIRAYGCQMNKSDAERISGVLEDFGYRKAENPEDAGLVLFVACSVRQSAIDRIYGQARKLKTRNPRPITVLTGCLLDRDKELLSEKFDLVFDIKDLSQLPEMLNSDSSPLRPPPSGLQNYFHIPSLYESSFSAYVPVMTGCDNFCSYCVVPYTRGREYSRPADEIIDEARSLVGKGYKEITLLGQNVNSYKREGGGRREEAGGSAVDFARLLRNINDIQGKFRIRFLTSHPKDMTDNLIDAIAGCEKICEYVHLPAQSGDDEILAKMDRKYTVAHYEKLLEKIRAKIPGVAISTDLIVGFPGETKKQFENTARLMRRAKYDMAYIAQYSPRPQTAASKMEDDVPRQEKKRREKTLFSILEKTALENNKKYLGKKAEILVEKISNGYAIGKTRSFKNVRFRMKKPPASETFMKVMITGATSWGLEGNA